MRQQIEGTQLWMERSHLTSTSRRVLLFDDRFGTMPIAVVFSHNTIPFVPVRVSPPDTSLLGVKETVWVASALQQAAAIAADFDTWWSDRASRKGDAIDALGTATKVEQRQ